MSDQYTQEELEGMTRVQLRRAALSILGIDNKEASNRKSGDLIAGILETQEGGGNDKPKSRSKASSKASTKSKAGGAKTGGRSKAKPKEDQGGNGVGAGADDLIRRIDALGKTVDENQEGLKEGLEEISAGIADIQRQQFFLFGLLSDVYKMVGEPDELAERLEEMDQEWDQQGNEDSD
jgi:hypothetical protein